MVELHIFASLGRIIYGVRGGLRWLIPTSDSDTGGYCGSADGYGRAGGVVRFGQSYCYCGRRGAALRRYVRAGRCTKRKSRTLP